MQIEAGQFETFPCEEFLAQQVENIFKFPISRSSIRAKYTAWIILLIKSPISVSRYRKPERIVKI